jgi:hypothetical protein
MKFDLASVIIMYLSVEGNAMAKDKIMRECQSGTVIIAIGVSLYPYKSKNAFTKNL